MDALEFGRTAERSKHEFRRAPLSARTCPVTTDPTTVREPDTGTGGKSGSRTPAVSMMQTAEPGAGQYHRVQRRLGLDVAVQHLQQGGAS